MEIEQLKAFLAIAEAKTFTAGAACECHPGAAISMQIRQLEDEVGLQLFTRTPRRVILTEAGEHLLSRARGCSASTIRQLPRSPSLAALSTDGCASVRRRRNLPRTSCRTILQAIRHKFPQCRTRRGSWHEPDARGQDNAWRDRYCVCQPAG